MNKRGKNMSALTFRTARINRSLPRAHLATASSSDAAISQQQTIACRVASSVKFNPCKPIRVHHVATPDNYCRLDKCPGSRPSIYTPLGFAFLGYTEIAVCFEIKM